MGSKSAPLTAPRFVQGLLLILAAGLFDGLLLDLDKGQAAVRGVVRMVEVNTTPPGATTRRTSS